MSLSAPFLQLPNPLLKALHRESQRLVTEFMGIAETMPSSVKVGVRPISATRR